MIEREPWWFWPLCVLLLPLMLVACALYPEERDGR